MDRRDIERAEQEMLETQGETFARIQQNAQRDREEMPLMSPIERVVHRKSKRDIGAYKKGFNAGFEGGLMLSTCLGLFLWFLLNYLL